MASFLNLNRSFATPAAFAAWLQTAPRPLFAPIGSTYHNTYRPHEPLWRGAASLRSMQAHYMTYQPPWDRGPHLFLAAGTAHDGIFLMTPLHVPGIHAGPCNARRFGVEVVADWDATLPTPAQITLLVDTLTVLHRWAGLGPDVVAHRDCMPGRTCPGRYGYALKDTLIALLTAALAAPPYTAASPLCAVVPDAHDAFVAAWQRRCAGTRQYALTDVHLIASQYWFQSTALGLDPWLVAAQCLHETANLTSWWCARPRRNPAGIGVTGQTRIGTARDSMPPTWAYDEAERLWRHGLSFSAWVTHSIPAHLGRLLAYALDDRAIAPFPHGHEPTLYHDQRRAIATALQYRPLPDHVRGSAPTLKQLGAAHNPTGLGWANPGTDYGTRIAVIANQLRGGST